MSETWSKGQVWRHQIRGPMAVLEIEDESIEMLEHLVDTIIADHEAMTRYREVIRVAADTLATMGNGEGLTVNDVIAHLESALASQAGESGAPAS